MEAGSSSEISPRAMCRVKARVECVSLICRRVFERNVWVMFNARITTKNKQQAVRLQSFKIASGRSISRVLSMAPRHHWAVISLGSRPEIKMERAVPYLCLTLLPAGVAWRARITTNAGGLLHHLFTMTDPHPQPFPRRRRESPLPSGEDEGGCLFLWPDPIDYSIPRFPRHCALRSADFPRS